MVTEFRMAWVGKGLKKTSNSNFLDMEEHLLPNQVALSLVQLGLEELKGLLASVTRREV